MVNQGLVLTSSARLEGYVNAFLAAFDSEFQALGGLLQSDKHVTERGQFREMLVQELRQLPPGQIDELISEGIYFASEGLGKLMRLECHADFSHGQDFYITVSGSPVSEI
jgi:hypothetical protein